MYKEDLALNNLQRLIRHKKTSQPNLIYFIYMYKEDLALNKLQCLKCHKTKPPNHPTNPTINSCLILFLNSFYYCSCYYKLNTPAALPTLL